MRVRSPLLLCLCAVTVGLLPAPVATAAGSGEFCGPGWQRITIPGVYATNRLSDLDGVASDIWAVGTTSGAASKPPAPLVERWDGSSWSASTVATTYARAGLLGVSRRTATDAWAVGWGDEGDGVDRALALRWNGSAWAQTAAAAPSGARLFAVDATGPSDAWAVGSTGTVERTLILHWDGSTWSVVTSPSPGEDAALLDVVAVSATEAWAVGTRHDVSGGPALPVVLRWIGGSWSAVATPAGAEGDLHAAGTASDGDLWTAGGGGGTAGLILHRQASGWTTTATSTPATWHGVSPLSDTDVWVSGHDTASPWSAHFDGTAWRTLAEPAGRGATWTESAGVLAVSADEVWSVGTARYTGTELTGLRQGPTAMRLCPLDVTDSGISKPTSRVSQGAGTLWRFPAVNSASHDVTDALGLGQGGSPLFTTGARAPGTTGTFRLDHAGTFPVVDTATGHTAGLTVPTEALPKKAPLGTTFTVFTSALGTLPSFLGTDIRYRKPGSEFWYRLVSGTKYGATPFAPDQTGMYTIQARLRNKVTGTFSGWSPFATINVAPS